PTPMRPARRSGPTPRKRAALCSKALNGCSDPCLSVFIRGYLLNKGPSGRAEVLLRLHPERCGAKPQDHAREHELCMRVPGDDAEEHEEGGHHGQCQAEDGDEDEEGFHRAVTPSAAASSFD